MLQATLFVFDYRGYGRSRGKPFERGCIADGMAAQRWLAEREGVATDEIVLMGRSIGGAVAVAMAAEQGAKALVLGAHVLADDRGGTGFVPVFPGELVHAKPVQLGEAHSAFRGAGLPMPRHGR